jgi:hypothetical protein
MNISRSVPCHPLRRPQCDEDGEASRFGTLCGDICGLIDRFAMERRVALMYGYGRRMVIFSTPSPPEPFLFNNPGYGWRGPYFDGKLPASAGSFSLSETVVRMKPLYSQHSLVLATESITLHDSGWGAPFILNALDLGTAALAEYRAVRDGREKEPEITSVATSRRCVSLSARSSASAWENAFFGPRQEILLAGGRLIDLQHNILADFSNYPDHKVECAHGAAVCYDPYGRRIIWESLGDPRSVRNLIRPSTSSVAHVFLLDANALLVVHGTDSRDSSIVDIRANRVIALPNDIYSLRTIFRSSAGDDTSAIASKSESPGGVTTVQKFDLAAARWRLAATIQDQNREYTFAEYTL